MPFIFNGQQVDFDKDVNEQIKAAPPVAVEKPKQVIKQVKTKDSLFNRTEQKIEPVVEPKKEVKLEQRVNIGSIEDLFAKSKEEKLKEVAAARPIIKQPERKISSSETNKIDNYEVHKDITLVRNRNKVAKRSQYLNDLLTFENK